MKLKDLAQQFQLGISTAFSILKRFKTQNTCIGSKAPGKPRGTTKAMDRNILRASREDPRRTSTEIQMVKSQLVLSWLCGSKKEDTKKQDWSLTRTDKQNHEKS
ncbi:unnamed protein product [Caenorhabditis sp. 36 PRJEB53466]|nr:unnamed protein product [Caenorhabditis sp. 36 PRJEB53466]